MFKVLFFAFVIFLHSSFGVIAVFSQCGPDGKRSCTPTTPRSRKKGTTPPSSRKKRNNPPETHKVPSPAKPVKPAVPTERPQQRTRKRLPKRTVPKEKKQGTRDESKAFVDQDAVIEQCSDPTKRVALTSGANRASEFLSQGKKWLTNVKVKDGPIRAINEFNNAIRINPCFSEAYYIRAYTSNKINGDIDEIIEDYSRTLKLDPKNTDAFLNRAMLLFNQKMEIEAAIRDLNEAIKLRPDTIAKIYTSRGNVYKFVRNYDAAYGDFKAAIDFDKNFFPAFYYRGITHLAELNYGAAIDDCTKAQLLIDAARSDSSLVQAESYNSYNLDEFGPKARQCITDANKENYKYEDEKTKATTDSPEGFRLRGNIHFKNSNFDLAIGDYKNAIDGYLKLLESNPSTPKARLVFSYLYRGLAYGRKKEYDLAIDDYNKIIGVNQGALGLENTLSDAWCKRGFAYAGKKEFEKAISDFNKAISLLGPGEITDAYYGRGLAYIEIGKLDLAIADLDLFVKFDTKNQPAYLRLAFLYDQMSLNEADLEKKAAYEQKAIDMRTKAKALSSGTKSKEENTPKP